MPILAWSCSEDALQGGGTTTPEAASKNYMEVSIQMPVTTRSSTPGDGQLDTEAGTDAESTIKEILIVVANTTATEGAPTISDISKIQDICFVKSVFPVADGTAKTEEGVHGNGKNKTYMARINSVALDTNKDRYYAVYAFVNPTNKMKENYKTAVQWADVKDLSEQAIVGQSVDDFIETYANTKKSRFLMTETNSNNDTGKDVYEAKEAACFKETIQGKETIYNLSTSVMVERAVARFDYKEKEGIMNNEYLLGEDETTNITVKLESYRLMNISKSFYHLKRTAENENSDEIVYGGNETPDNYVVDYDWAAKKAWYNEDIKPQTDDLFFIPLVNTAVSNGNTKATSDDGYIKLEDLNEEGVTQDGKIMGYCTENTIPGIATQVNGLTTGIVFKGKVIGDYVKNAESYALYEFNDVRYNKWEDFKKVWNETYSSPEYSLDDENYAQEPDPTDPGDTEKLNNLREKLAGKAKRIPILGSDSDKHCYVYYIYWNRHNDNGNNSLMGPMEFAVVRNNIYKLTVTKISELGHPNDPTDTTDPQEPDPDPVEPGKDDEVSKAYMEVTVNILDWTVRENEIEF